MHEHKQDHVPVSVSCVGPGITYLGHTRSRLVGLLLVSPVSSGEGVLQAVGDGLGTNGQLKVEVLSGGRRGMGLSYKHHTKLSPQTLTTDAHYRRSLQTFTTDTHYRHSLHTTVHHTGTDSLTLPLSMNFCA